MQIALAWLLHRAPNIPLIPGTSSVKHLQENLQAAALQLSPETIAKAPPKISLFKYKLQSNNRPRTGV
jgi:aryl-alcohol dehydrogenase-like predicted oxidoreductase